MLRKAFIALVLIVASVQGQGNMPKVRLMTLEPGHFHAALIQKEMYPDVAPQVHVYGPLGFDLTEHLNRIARFNLRADKPTHGISKSTPAPTASRAC